MKKCASHTTMPLDLTQTALLVKNICAHTGSGRPSKSVSPSHSVSGVESLDIAADMRLLARKPMETLYPAAVAVQDHRAQRNQAPFCSPDFCGHGWTKVR